MSELDLDSVPARPVKTHAELMAARRIAVDLALDKIKVANRSKAAEARRASGEALVRSHLYDLDSKGALPTINMTGKGITRVDGTRRSAKPKSG